MKRIGWLLLLVLSACKTEPMVSDESSAISSSSRSTLPINANLVVAGETGKIPSPNQQTTQDKGMTPQGPMGPMGPMGPQGIQGDKGAKGDRGEQGERGYAGRDGNSILAGMFDPRPEQGKDEDLYFDQERGDVYKKVSGAWELVANLMGQKGERGEQGLQGEQGIQGERGEKGDTGDRGEQGLQGIRGDRGEQGLQGIRGDRGEQGLQGIQGLQGFQGLQGNQGERGEQGAKGDTGERGLQGNQGERGFQGLQGIQGERGEQGAKGDTGERGSNAGIVAEAATTCPEEANGGVKFTTYVDDNHNARLDEMELVTSISVVCGGLAGKDGRAGESARLTTQLASQDQCATGGYVFTVQNPDEELQTFPVCNGAQGLRGLQGETGAAGAAGSSVTPVKFCASDRSSFPEYGLRIGNELFAVYWGTAPYSPNASTAFLAKVIPGSYRSTGGNGCYFWVASNGAIYER